VNKMTVIMSVLSLSLPIASMASNAERESRRDGDERAVVIRHTESRASSQSMRHISIPRTRGDQERTAAVVATPVVRAALAAPEIDAVSGIGALTFLFGSLAVLGGRRERALR
jgi:hypothetical protein